MAADANYDPGKMPRWRAIKREMPDRVVGTARALAPANPDKAA